MHSRLWLSDARGESSPRAGSHYLEFFYAQKGKAEGTHLSFRFSTIFYLGHQLSRDGSAQWLEGLQNKDVAHEPLQN
jgi:hypothetical protein